MREGYRMPAYNARGGPSRWGSRGRGRGGPNVRAYPYPTSSSQSSPLAQPCAIYTRTGRCDQGPACRYKHDPNHVALCQALFMTGRCSSAGNTRCYMSHKPQPQNTPMCLHFARGRCDKEDCKFTHMTNLGDDPNAAEVCRQFAMVGWCEKGAGCNRRHCFDCPDFDAQGKCDNPNCKLQHVIKSQKPRPATMNSTPSSNTKLGGQSTINIDAFVNFLESFNGEKSFAASRALAGSKDDNAGVLDHIDEEDSSALDARGIDASSDADSDTDKHEFDFVESMHAAQQNHESIDATADFVQV